MNKFNIYYYGEDRSHCDSCWERDDEDITILITTLSLEEMKEKLNEYCDFLFDEKFKYASFLESVASEGYDPDEEKIVYPCIFFEQSGTSYCPDFYKSNCIEEEYDVEKYLNPEKEVSNWKDLVKEWAEREEEKKKRDEENRKRKEKNAEKQRKYREKKKEYEDYLKLKTKWEGSKEPEEPIEDLTAFEKILKEVRMKGGS